MYLTKKIRNDQFLTKKCEDLPKNAKETHRGLIKKKNMFKCK